MEILEKYKAVNMKMKFKSVKPRVNKTNRCSRCEKFYNDKDVVILQEGAVCLNCLDTKNPEDKNKMLKARFQQEDIMTIQHIQYPLCIEDHKNEKEI